MAGNRPLNGKLKKRNRIRVKELHLLKDENDKSSKWKKENKRKLFRDNGKRDEFLLSSLKAKVPAIKSLHIMVY